MPVDMIRYVDLDHFGARVTLDCLWIRGVLFYEGHLVPAYDLQGLLCEQETESKGYVICCLEGEEAAFVVSELEEISYVSKQEFDEASQEEKDGILFPVIEQNGERIILFQEELLRVINEKTRR